MHTVCRTSKFCKSRSRNLKTRTNMQSFYIRLVALGVYVNITGLGFGVSGRRKRNDCGFRLQRDPHDKSPGICVGKSLPS